MADYELNLWDYWRIVYKRKWIIISIFLVSIISSYLFVEKSVPLYKSSVMLYINTQRTPVAEITGAGVTFWGGGTGNILTQLELIKSSKILRVVGEKLGYINEKTTPEEAQDVILALRAKISVGEEENTELVTISVLDADPKKAQRIASVVADVFMEKNWEDKVEEARNTVCRQTKWDNLVRFFSCDFSSYFNYTVKFPSFKQSFLF